MKQKMSLMVFACTLAFASGCGRSSSDNEMTGQVKRVMKNMSFICPEYNDAVISMGVFRNGIGSASKEDIWLYVPDKQDYEKLKSALSTGALVKINYDVHRWAWCVEDHWVTSVEEIK